MPSQKKLQRNSRAAEDKFQRRAKELDTTAQKLRKILEQVDKLPTLDYRSDDEILGYNENGVPR